MESRERPKEVDRVGPVRVESLMMLSTMPVRVLLVSVPVHFGVFKTQEGESVRDSRRKKKKALCAV
jgi:hypothetical protein